MGNLAQEPLANGFYAAFLSQLGASLHYNPCYFLKQKGCKQCLQPLLLKRQSDYFLVSPGPFTMFSRMLVSACMFCIL